MGKKWLIVLALGVVFYSCSKESDGKKDDNICPVIADSLVPKIVKDSFAVKYSSMQVITWFQKDSIGYTAYFLGTAATKMFATFSAAGVFIEEDTADHEGDHQEDSTGTPGSKPVTEGCECEIDD